ncbi:hypothetical protein A2U01_0022090 [Trifolium medium]|uniref:Uncharacterized protein n=1 Tax=Trifolium medium TaxID=97028 RepID=A0A392NPQ9_9FABA|nr:hypothetical protein [Trifolium medium]
MDARALRRKDAFRGERPWGVLSMIHGSPIEKPYRSSAASLRSLDFYSFDLSERIRLSINQFLNSTFISLYAVHDWVGI